MNIERITQLRDFIAALPPERVAMNVFVASVDDDPDTEDDLALCGAGVALDNHTCKTVACIAGWATYLFDPKSPMPTFTNARDALDLDHDQSDALFTPLFWEYPGRYTQADVVATLTRLIETGEVQWG